MIRDPAIEPNRRPQQLYGTLFLSLAISCLTSCAGSSHKFAEPAPNWQTRHGQLLYRKEQTTLIGEVLVRFSNGGDFELTFSKGASVTILFLQQDGKFAKVAGPLAGRGWSGPLERAPQPLQGWLGLREALIHAGNRKSVRQVVGGETFLFRF